MAKVRPCADCRDPREGSTKQVTQTKFVIPLTGIITSDIYENSDIYRHDLG
jgi:hypothetical protein